MYIEIIVIILGVVKEDRRGYKYRKIYLFWGLGNRFLEGSND